MPYPRNQMVAFLSSMHPYDALPVEALSDIAGQLTEVTLAAGDAVYQLGDELAGLYIVKDGEVEVRDENDAPISLLGARNSFGERGLTRSGLAVTSAVARSDCELLLLPAAAFHALIKAHEPARRFFDRSRAPRDAGRNDLATSRVETLMSSPPITCAPDTTAHGAAQTMKDRHISSLCVTKGDALLGIVTMRGLIVKVLAEGLPPTTPVSEIMTKAPLTLTPNSLGSDVLHLMMERRIGHVPIMQAGKLVGMVTQTNLTRFQAVSSAELVRDITDAPDADAMALVTARIPELLVQLVAGGNNHDVVTRLITDIADTVTRRLLQLGEAKLGPAPVPYLWLACGSQGRQEQTGVSDQDNCLFLDDAATDADMAYFRELAQFVCDGLNTCGYVYCPGDMMATNTRWCQPVKVWRSYFEGWIASPSQEAQMLASVMFDLRPIGGDESLFRGLQKDILTKAAGNSIFVQHMIGNSLTHTPPLGLLRGFATIRSGEHKNQLDLKHNGVVPVVDMGRIYALRGQLTAVNTRARLVAAADAGLLSKAGGRDLLDAYDMIAETRLAHQADRVKAGLKPDNFMAPTDLSDFERSHLRDAFVVIKTMQSSLGSGGSVLR